MLAVVLRKSARSCSSEKFRGARPGDLWEGRRLREKHTSIFDTCATTAVLAPARSVSNLRSNQFIYFLQAVFLALPIITGLQELCISSIEFVFANVPRSVPFLMSLVLI